MKETVKENSCRRGSRSFASCPSGLVSLARSMLPFNVRILILVLAASKLQPVLISPPTLGSKFLGNAEKTCSVQILITWHSSIKSRTRILEQGRDFGLLHL